MRTLLAAGVVGCVIAICGAPARSADLGPIVKAPLAPPPFSWTGLYVGVNLGAVRGTADMSDIGVPFPPFNNAAATIFTPAALGVFPNTSGSDTSVIGGGQFGYNWQTDRWIWGVEADIDGTSLDAQSASTIARTTLSGTQSVTENYAAHLDWIATLRGRFGIAWDRTMIYATAGLATGGVRVDTTHTIVQPAPTPTPGTASATGQMVGWTAGIGAEWAFDRNVSAAVEYRHTDLGALGFNAGFVDVSLAPFVGPNSGSVHYVADQVTLRVNWRPWQ
jgi:outer membrane immunogenic protein